MHDGKENSYFVQRYKALYRKPGGTVPLGLTFLGPVSRPENEQAEVTTNNKDGLCFFSQDCISVRLKEEITTLGDTQSFFIN